MELTGVARILPDDVNTDYIISSGRKRDAAGALELVPFIFEDLPSPLPRPLEPGDIIVAGWNFGCGSAMEIAAEVLKAAQVQAIIARSVARTFYRNTVNLGIPILELAADQADQTAPWCAEGDRVMVAFASEAGRAGVRNLSSRYPDSLVRCRPPAAFALELVKRGGLISYYLQKGSLPRGIL